MRYDSQETCWTVLRAAAAGDHHASSLFAHNYSALIRTYYARRWAGRGLGSSIDDAVQDVFVECIKPGGVLHRADPGRGDFRGLLYGVTCNVARRYEEREAQRLGRCAGESVHLDDQPDRALTLSRMFDRVWARSLVRQALLRHATKARAGGGGDRRRYKVLRLRHHRGLPIREVAAVLGEADVELVHGEYRRARREFGRTLGEVVAATTGARGPAVAAQCRDLIALLET